MLLFFVQSRQMQPEFFMSRSDRVPKSLAGWSLAYLSTAQHHSTVALDLAANFWNCLPLASVPAAMLGVARCAGILQA